MADSIAAARPLQVVRGDDDVVEADGAVGVLDEHRSRRRGRLGPQAVDVGDDAVGGLAVEARQRPADDAGLGVGIEPDAGAEQRDRAVDDGQAEALPRLGRAADDEPLGAGGHVGRVQRRAARRGT